MRKRKIITAIGMLAIGTAVSATQAGELYTIRTGDDMLRMFDTNTLTFTDIGPIGVPFDFGGMSWDSSTGTMYLVQGFAGSGLYTVDITDGTTTLVGDHGFTDMFSLAYDSANGTMYSGRSSGGATGFYSMDLSSGTATLIGDPGINLDGLTYDPVRDEVVGAYAGPGDLYDMNLTSGSASLIYDGDFFNNAGLAWDADTQLYWMIDWSGVMYTFDPNNGFARSTIMTGLGAHDSLSAATGGGPSDCLTMTVSTLTGGQNGQWDVSGATAGSLVAVVYGTQAGSTIVNGQLGFCATFGIQGVTQSKLVGTATADGSGNATITKNIPGAASGLTVLTQAAEQGTCPDECVSGVDTQVVQ